MAIKYSVDLNQNGRYYPHYWEFCVGSCHAATILREDVREQIRRAHNDIGFQYLRFHGLFDEDMSVVLEDIYSGEINISFYNIDCVFDFLLDTGMKPFVEIGFMPETFASGTQTCFHYKGNVTLPKSFDQWSDFIRLFIRHILERYGKEEVETWLFEVWNEPNLNFFFDGTQEDYFRLYEVTARTIKSVDKDLRVGGPATSVNAWITPFRDYCNEKDVPLDFISTHHYPSDDPLSTAGMNGPGKKGTNGFSLEGKSQEEIEEIISKIINKQNTNPRDVMLQMAKKAKAEAGNYPLYYTEWNGAKEFDTSYQAAFVIQTLAYNEGLVEGYSFWTVSDVFEEFGLKPAAFKNEFGLQTMHGIKKPVYHVFESLHKAGEYRLDVTGEKHTTAEVFALRDQTTATIFVYNHDLERRNIREEVVTLILTGNFRKIEKAVIDEHHCNPLEMWNRMGSPVYLKKEEVEVLKIESTLKYETVEGKISDGMEIDVMMEPESVVIFKVTY